jgi:hypothetical protein
MASSFMHKILRGACASAVAAALTAVFPAPRAHAVIIAQGAGTQNTTQPTGVASWFNVGKISLGAGIYVGNRWVLTAQHLDPFTNNSITFYPTDGYPNGGVTYTIDQTTVVRIKNADGSDTDMALGRLTTDPGLPTLNLSTATPTVNTAITMAGFGVARGAAVHYQVTGSNWVQVGSGGNYSGYQFNPNDVFNPSIVSKRWGTNLTTTFPGGSLTAVVPNTGNGSLTTVFTADFTDPAGSATTSEAIGVSGDSGGAVFSSTNPNTLLGIMLYQDALNTPPGQPQGTAIYGNGTDSADLSKYYSQIFTVTGVPEPSCALLFLGASSALGLRRKRR